MRCDDLGAENRQQLLVARLVLFELSQSIKGGIKDKMNFDPIPGLNFFSNNFKSLDAGNCYIIRAWSVLELARRLHELEL